MRLTSVIFTLFFVGFNSNIKFSVSRKTVCFNMIYQRNGLNFELSLDTLLIKAMTVANYRPFQMCASVPGLLFTSICVHILELNQFPRSITVCPRVEVVSKKERWQITYICSSISTTLPPVTAASAPAQPMPFGGAAMMGQMPPGMPGQMMPPAGMMMQRPTAPASPMGQMPPAGQMMMPGGAAMGQRPPGAPMMGAMPAAMPGAGQMMMMMPGGAAMGQRPPGAPMMGAMPTGAGQMMMAPGGAAMAPRPPGAPAMMGTMSGAGQMMMAPGGAAMAPRPPGAPAMMGAMPGAGQMMMAPGGAAMAPRPPGAPAMMGAMPPAAAGMGQMPAPAAMGQMPPAGGPMPAGMPGAAAMGQRPPASGPMPGPPAAAQMAGAAAAMPRPPGVIGLMPAGAAAAMGQRPAGAPMMPAMGPMPPRPVAGAPVITGRFTYNTEPSFRLHQQVSTLGTETYVAEAAENVEQLTEVPAESNVNLTAADDQDLVAEASYVEQATVAPETVADWEVSDGAQESIDYLTQPVVTAEDNDQELISEHTSEKIVMAEDSEQQLMMEQVAESSNVAVEDSGSRTLKRRKRNYDVFDMFHQANRCERAYRICITRSKQYIVSRLRNSRRNGHKVKNECADQPARIVYDSEENTCSHASSSDVSDSPVVTTIPIQASDPISETVDPLGAIIVHDESAESSDYYPQNSPYTIPITANNRPEIFPMRTPSLILELQQRLSRNLNSNDTLIFTESLFNPNAFDNEALVRSTNK